MTPDPPYYAVIFTSQRTDTEEGYIETAEKMVKLAAGRPGFLGVESVRDSDGTGITVSYWRDESDIKAWKEDLKHQVAQRLGREKWYRHYTVRIAKIEQTYYFRRD